MPVLGFIERYDWNGKRVIPVNTSEGSGAGQSVQKIRVKPPMIAIVLAKAQK